MAMQLVALFMAIAAAVFFHEAGHWLAARMFGHTLQFTFDWGEWHVVLFGNPVIVKIPRFMWDMPEIVLWKQRIIAAAGFVFEVGLALFLMPVGGIMCLYYLAFCAVHLSLYMQYAVCR